MSNKSKKVASLVWLIAPIAASGGLEANSVNGHLGHAEVIGLLRLVAIAID
jgi:hypothetical protein